MKLRIFNKYATFETEASDMFYFLELQTNDMSYQHNTLYMVTL
jgi:hypothetical protein